MYIKITGWQKKINKNTAETPKVNYLHETVLGSKMILHAPLICDHADTTYSEILRPETSVCLAVCFVCQSVWVFQFVREIFPFFYKNLLSIKNKSSPYFPTARILLEQQGTLPVKKEEAIVVGL